VLANWTTYPWTTGATYNVTATCTLSGIPASTATVLVGPIP
jgi:hypothetical protein